MIPSLYEKFQEWSRTGSVYIISDTHFEDSDCKLMDTNWLSPEEAVAILKKKVHKCDTLIHLGDVGNIEYIRQLKCHKVLIMGNHDTGVTKFREVFNEVYEGPLMIGEKILLSHEPILGIDWCLNIHGHDHSGKYIDEYHLNLASNVCGFKPLSLGEYIKNHGLNRIKSLHRDTINRAAERKQKRGERYCLKTRNAPKSL